MRSTNEKLFENHKHNNEHNFNHYLTDSVPQLVQETLSENSNITIQEFSMALYSIKYKHKLNVDSVNDILELFSLVLGKNNR